jgi:SnoaL-like domain
LRRRRRLPEQRNRWSEGRVYHADHRLAFAPTPATTEEGSWRRAQASTRFTSSGGRCGSPQNYDAIDELVVEDFEFISGGNRIEGREAFKKWVEDFSAAIGNFDSEVLDSFEDCDGSRVALAFRVTGTNNGAFGTKPDGSPIELTGIVISAVRDDGMLLSNRVERNAFEVYKRLTAG